MYIIYLNLVVQGLIPFTTLLVLNILIYIQLVAYEKESRETVQPRMKQLQHAKEVRLASVSLFIVLGESHHSHGVFELTLKHFCAVFSVCHGVKWVPNIWELQQTKQEDDKMTSMVEVMLWPAWVEYLTHTSHLLITFNCSVNFYIYLIKVTFLHLPD